MLATLIENIVLTIITSGVVGIGTLAISRLFWKRIELRRERSRWSTDGSRILETVVSESCCKIEEETGTTISATGRSQIYALSAIAPSILAAHGQLAPDRIRFPNEFELVDETDLLLIGGPINNTITNRVLNDLFFRTGIIIYQEKLIVLCEHLSKRAKSLMPYATTKTYIVTKAKESNKIITYFEPYRSELSHIQTVDPVQGEVRERGVSSTAIELSRNSYGLVVRTKNPLSGSGRMVMIAGSDQWGTMAAAKFFSSNEIFSVRTKKEHVFVVKTDRYRFGNTAPELLAHWPVRNV